SSKPISKRDGSVKATPAASDSPAEPAVWAMLFSRMVARRTRKARASQRKRGIDITATGIEAETGRPTLRLKQRGEKRKTNPSAVPMATGSTVSSGGLSSGEINGLNAPPGGVASRVELASAAASVSMRGERHVARKTPDAHASCSSELTRQEEVSSSTGLL